MERCERFEELLSQRLDQPLPPEEERELEDHLAHCPSCRALAADLEQLCGQFACLEELPAPEGFVQGVMDRIRALEPEQAPAETPEVPEEEPKQPKQQDKVVPIRRTLPRWARTAAALAACCVLGFGVYQAGLMDNVSPADQSQSGESVGASSGVAAYAAPVPGEGEGASSAVATLPAPEEGQRSVYDDWTQQNQNASVGGQKEDAASTQKRSAQVPVHSQAAPSGQQESVAPAQNDTSSAAGDTGDVSGNTESVVGSQAVQTAPQTGGLTLPQLPQGAEEVLDKETAWTDNGDGTRSCTLTADQARQLLALAREQGMNCPDVETETAGEETLVLTVPGDEK